MCTQPDIPDASCNLPPAIEFYGVPERIDKALSSLRDTRPGYGMTGFANMWMGEER